MLIERLEETGASLTVIEPDELLPQSADGFNGVVVSGGRLPAETFKRNLAAYSDFLRELDQPLLGVCLGIRILAHYYGARTRRVTPVVGMRRLHFFREFPLARGVGDCEVYQSHSHEVISPLPQTLENFATGASPVEVLRVRGEERFGVQFHPELSGEPAVGILRSFVSLCGR